MFGIPRRYSHYVFGVIQSGLTCAVAAAIASFLSYPKELSPAAGFSRGRSLG